MRDFTLHTLRLLLTALKEQHYTFQTFAAFLKDPAPRAIVLRHDVDARKRNSLVTAEIEAALGITGTYNFRMVVQSFDIDIIRQIAAMGHEIGYHYEDLSAAKGDHKKAIRLFEQNLSKLRRLVPVETICMQGNPLSKYDNRRLWDKYNYKDYGIIGEPYFDLDFSNVLYLTDTGRRWDGEKVSVRDKVGKGTRDQGQGTSKDNPQQSQQPQQSQPSQPLLTCPLSSTFDIILHAPLLPDRIMLTLHPQRWDDHLLPWIREYIWQNIKNVVKKMMVR